MFFCNLINHLWLGCNLIYYFFLRLQFSLFLIILHSFSSLLLLVFCLSAHTSVWSSFSLKPFQYFIYFVNIIQLYYYGPSMLAVSTASHLTLDSPRLLVFTVWYSIFRRKTYTCILSIIMLAQSTSIFVSCLQYWWASFKLLSNRTIYFLFVLSETFHKIQEQLAFQQSPPQTSIAGSQVSE